MKKLLTLTAAMLTVMGMNADPITPSRALQIAQEYMVPGYTMSVQLEGEAKARTPLAMKETCACTSMSTTKPPRNGQKSATS